MRAKTHPQAVPEVDEASVSTTDSTSDPSATRPTKEAPQNYRSRVAGNRLWSRVFWSDDKCSGNRRALGVDVAGCLRLQEAAGCDLRLW